MMAERRLDELVGTLAEALSGELEEASVETLHGGLVETVETLAELSDVLVPMGGSLCPGCDPEGIGRIEDRIFPILFSLMLLFLLRSPIRLFRDRPC